MPKPAAPPDALTLAVQAAAHVAADDTHFGWIYRNGETDIDVDWSTYRDGTGHIAIRPTWPPTYEMAAVTAPVAAVPVVVAGAYRTPLTVAPAGWSHARLTLGGCTIDLDAAGVLQLTEALLACSTPTVEEAHGRRVVAETLGGSAVTAPETAWLLRTCAADMSSWGGFRWPETGPISCPDWDPTPVCGHGLHGLLDGEGDGSLLSWEPDAKWLVVQVAAADVVPIGPKVKVPCGVVVFCGDRAAATAFLVAKRPGKAVVGSTLTGGDGSTLTGGYGSTLTGGYGSTLTGGDGSTLTARYYDTTKGRYRRKWAEVGEDGIKADTPYRLDAEGRWVEVQP